METQESLPISDVMYILLLVWNIVYIVYHPSLYHFLPCTEQLIEWKYMVYFIMNQIVIMEVPQHILVIATSHEKKFMTFSILRGTCTVIQAHNFVMFLSLIMTKN